MRTAVEGTQPTARAAPHCATGRPPPSAAFRVTGLAVQSAQPQLCGSSCAMTNRNTVDPTLSSASHDRGARRAAGGAALAAALTLACAVSLPAAAHALRMAFDVCDTTGQHVDVRVGVKANGYGLWYPQLPDTLIMAHNGYAYPSAGDGLVAPFGSTTVSISHGPEWVPQMLSVWVAKDTTLTVQLHSFLDMRALGFYSGDVHVHSQHPPIDFEVSTANALRIAR